jgi:tRNA(His) guanylyltransferase
MACSKYSYVKNFETQDSLLPCTYIVIRVDGKGFHKFCNLNNFAKPNELSAIHLMNLAAKEVMKNFREIFIAYG